VQANLSMPAAAIIPVIECPGVPDAVKWLEEAMETKLADSARDHVEVTIKMPARLHDHLASICLRSDVKLDDIVCEQIERWLLRQAITRLEAPDESKEV
jgi:hypothetical protein